MIRAVIEGGGEPLPCSVLLQGEYGERDLMVGVPAVLGLNGVERIIELDLDAEERTQFTAAVTHIRERNKGVRSFL